MTDAEKNTYSEEEWLALVGYEGNRLRYVPEESKTYKLCLAAVKHTGPTITYVPRDHMTPELCLAAVQQSGIVLRSIPNELKTPEICLAAMKNGGFTSDVPEDKLTPEMEKASQAFVASRSDVNYFEATAGGSSYTVFDQAEFANEGLLFADKPFGPV
jgi:hypothetical protein